MNIHEVFIFKRCASYPINGNICLLSYVDHDLLRIQSQQTKNGVHTILSLSLSVTHCARARVCVCVCVRARACVCVSGCYCSLKHILEKQFVGIRL